MQLIYKKKNFSPTSGSALISRIKSRFFFLPHFQKKTSNFGFLFEAAAPLTSDMGGELEGEGEIEGRLEI